MAQVAGRQTQPAPDMRCPFGISSGRHCSCAALSLRGFSRLEEFGVPTGGARNESNPAKYGRDLTPLAFLSPKIIEAIVEGRQPPELTIISLARRIDIPLLWRAQQQVLRLADSKPPQPPEIAEESSGGPPKLRPDSYAGFVAKSGIPGLLWSLLCAENPRRRAVFSQFSEDSARPDTRAWMTQSDANRSPAF
jgi:hypothetical protein